MRPFLLFVIALSFSLWRAGAQQPADSGTTVDVPAVEAAPASPAPLAAPAMAAPASTPEMAAAPAPAATVLSGPAPERNRYSACHVNGPYVALTFDDGPSAKLTPELLDMLKQRGVKVTFFVIGQNVAANPDIVRRAVQEGHEIGNHSWSHPQLSKLSAAAVAKEIGDTSDAIVKACGVKPVLMRPPYGATNAMVDKIIHEDGMKEILWEVDPLDWKIRNSDHVYNAIVTETHPGDIVLSHDIHATTVAAVPRILDTLLAKGYKFVTVSQLIAMDHPLPPEPKSSPTAHHKHAAAS